MNYPECDRVRIRVFFRPGITVTAWPPVYDVGGPSSTVFAFVRRPPGCHELPGDPPGTMVVQ